MSPFALRKLHSATGVLPVGAFFVLHLWTQSSAHGGRRAYDEVMEGALSIPLQPALELAFVLLPLAFHGVLGLAIVSRSRPTVGAHPTSRSWMYVAQRVTGVLTFLFVLWHAGATWAQRIGGEVRAEQMHQHLVNHLSTTTAGLPLAALATMLGVGCASFHLSNGLWGAAVSWGLCVTRRSQALLGVASVVLGVSLFVLGTDLVALLATGRRALPLSPAATAPRDEPPPPAAPGRP